MNNSNQNRLGRIIPILTLIIAIIALLVSLYIYFYLTPYLTYEKASYPLLSGETLYVVIVRNEGHATADDVEIYINTKGQIKNVMVHRGPINMGIEEGAILGTNKSHFRTNFSHHHCEIVCTLCLTVSEHKNDKTPECILITHRDGIATEHKQSCFIPFVIGLGLGVGSIGVIILLFQNINIKVEYRNKKDEKRNRDEARGEDAKKD